MRHKRANTKNCQKEKSPSTNNFNKFKSNTPNVYQPKLNSASNYRQINSISIKVSNNLQRNKADCHNSKKS